MTELMRRRRALMGVGGSPYEHGTWDDLFYCIDNGTYATDYALGEILPLDLGAEGVVNAQIIEFNTDDKADGTGKAPVTFFSQHMLPTTHRWNPVLSGTTEGTGTIGGWAKSEIRTYVQTDIKALFPSSVLNRITKVIKYSNIYDTTGTAVNNSATVDDIWIPSSREVKLNAIETTGPAYSIFTDNNSRIRTKPDGNGGAYHLRSAHSTSSNRSCSNVGQSGAYGAQTKLNVLIGFCIG